MENRVIRVMFVCLGNICRSPMAEAVFRNIVNDAGLASQFEVASAGTGNWHVGERPHRGTLAILRDKMVDVGGKRAQQLQRADLNDYDYVVAMDDENVADIQQRFGKRVKRLMEFASTAKTLNVPDPYYTGNFEEVYDLVTAGCQGLLTHIREQEGI